MHLGTLVDGIAASHPDRVALIEGDESTTYADLVRAAESFADGLRAADVPVGARVPWTGEAGRAAAAAVLGTARHGAALALLNPRLTDGERATLVAHLGGRMEQPDETVVLFTSGTTGLPKPVAFTHATVLGRIRTFATPVGDAAQVRLLCAPIHHVGGLLGLLVSLAGGHTTVVQPRFEAGEWLRLVEVHRVAISFVVPAMLERVLDHPDFGRRDLTSLTSLSYGAAPMRADLIDRAVAALPHVGFSNTFGQTETLGGITVLTADDHRDPARRTSLGRALPGVALRVIEPDTDADVTDGEPGELLVHGPHTDGWVRTGDLVRRDADGYLYSVGRLRDTINRGGEKFGPVEVEEVLRGHPSIADVAVAGVPDPELGERVGAAIVVRGGGDTRALAEWCRGRIAQYKVPDRIVVVDAIPYTDLGKVDRRAVVRLVEGG